MLLSEAHQLIRFMTSAATQTNAQMMQGDKFWLQMQSVQRTMMGGAAYPCEVRL